MIYGSVVLHGPGPCELCVSPPSCYEHPAVCAVRHCCAPPLLEGGCNALRVSAATTIPDACILDHVWNTYSWYPSIWMDVEYVRYWHSDTPYSIVCSSAVLCTVICSTRSIPLPAGGGYALLCIMWIPMDHVLGHGIQGPWIMTPDQVSRYRSWSHAMLHIVSTVYSESP